MKLNAIAASQAGVTTGNEPADWIRTLPRDGTILVKHIGSGLDAAYADTRMQRLRSYPGSLVESLLKAQRTREVEWHSGVLLTASRDTILPHRLADAGNKFKKFRAREESRPVENVKARVRVPADRVVENLTLLRAGRTVNAPLRLGWVEATVPRVFVHEAMRMDLV